MQQERPREADIETATGDRIDHADFAGKFQRMVEHRQHRAGDQPRPLGALRRRREKDERVRAVATVMMKIVFDGADVRIAQPIGRLAQVQALGEVVHGGLGVRADRREELNAELHLRASFSRIPGEALNSRLR